MSITSKSLHWVQRLSIINSRKQSCQNIIIIKMQKSKCSLFTVLVKISWIKNNLFEIGQVIINLLIRKNVCPPNLIKWRLLIAFNIKIQKILAVNRFCKLIISQLAHQKILRHILGGIFHEQQVLLSPLIFFFDDPMPLLVYLVKKGIGVDVCNLRDVFWRDLVLMAYGNVFGCWAVFFFEIFLVDVFFLFFEILLVVFWGLCLLQTFYFRYDVLNFFILFL